MVVMVVVVTVVAVVAVMVVMEIMVAMVMAMAAAASSSSVGHENPRLDHDLLEQICTMDLANHFSMLGGKLIDNPQALIYVCPI